MKNPWDVPWTTLGTPQGHPKAFRRYHYIQKGYDKIKGRKFWWEKKSAEWARKNPPKYFWFLKRGDKGGGGHHGGADAVELVLRRGQAQERRRVLKHLITDKTDTMLSSIAKDCLFLYMYISIQEKTEFFFCLLNFYRFNFFFFSTTNLSLYASVI